MSACKSNICIVIDESGSVVSFDIYEVHISEGPFSNGVTSTLTIEGTPYVMTWDTDRHTTISNFVTLHSANIIAAHNIDSVLTPNASGQYYAIRLQSTPVYNGGTELFDINRIPFNLISFAGTIPSTSIVTQASEIAIMRIFLKNLIESFTIPLAAGDMQISLVAFATSSVVRQLPTSNIGDLITGLGLNDLSSRINGTTNIIKGLCEAESLLEDPLYDNGGEKTVLLFIDGNQSVAVSTNCSTISNTITADNTAYALTGKLLEYANDLKTLANYKINLLVTGNNSEIRGVLNQIGGEFDDDSLGIGTSVPNILDLPYYPISSPGNGVDRLGNSITYEGVEYSSFEADFDNLEQVAIAVSSGIACEEPPIVSVPPEADIVSTNVTCFGVCDGTITINVTSGNSPFVYKIIGSLGAIESSEPLFEGLCADTYLVSVTDVDGFETLAEEVIITEPDEIEVVIAVTGISCSGLEDGVINAVPDGKIEGDPYSYSLDGIEYQETGLFTGLAEGDYTLYVQDNVTECVIEHELSILGSVAQTIRLTNCVTENTFLVPYTEVLNDYIGRTIRVLSSSGAIVCYTVSESTTCTGVQEFDGEIIGCFSKCENCVQECKCTRAKNSGEVSKYLQYIDCDGEIQTTVELVGVGKYSKKYCVLQWLDEDVNEEDILEFGNCEDNECPIVPVPKAFVAPGYNTLLCSTEAYERIVCKYSEYKYKEILSKRYGISNCCEDEELLADIRFELLQLEILRDPDYECFSNNGDCGCVPDIGASNSSTCF